MNQSIFKKRYKTFNASDSDIEEWIQTILKFEKYILKDISDVTISDIQMYMNYLIDIEKNTYSNVIHFSRYFYYIGKKEEYIHMTKYFNSIGVLENILDRISLYESKTIQEEVIKNIQLPPFGIDSQELPKYTKEFMEKLERYLPRSKCNKILAGNNHKIPSSSFDQEKEIYNSFDTFEEYLKDKHRRKIEELQYHLDNNKVWFEQVITKEAIDYVKSNQEILSGVKKGNKLYVTKIPYEISNFLNAKEDKLKRYYACHCSFVRENILSENEDIPKEWCYCSAGFAKYPFEQILGRELDVKLLNTPIDGDYICRFEIDLGSIEK